MKKNLLFFSLLIIGVIFNACIEKNMPIKSNQRVVTLPTPMPTPIPVRTTQPSTNGEYHQLMTVQGQLLAVQEKRTGFIFPQYRDKIILLQIFGQDCPYCFKEIPIINRIRQRYSNNLQVLAFQAQEPMTKQTAYTLIQRFQMNYPIVDKDEAKGLLYFIQKNYGWTGVLPYILIIKNGVTEYSFPGEVSHKELDEAVRDLL